MATLLQKYLKMKQLRIESVPAHLLLLCKNSLKNDNGLTKKVCEDAVVIQMRYTKAAVCFTKKIKLDLECNILEE